MNENLSGLFENGMEWLQGMVARLHNMQELHAQHLVASAAAVKAMGEKL